MGSASLAAPRAMLRHWRTPGGGAGRGRKRISASNCLVASSICTVGVTFVPCRTVVGLGGAWQRVAARPENEAACQTDKKGRPTLRRAKPGQSSPVAMGGRVLQRLLLTSLPIPMDGEGRLRECGAARVKLAHPATPRPAPCARGVR